MKHLVFFSVLALATLPVAAAESTASAPAASKQDGSQAKELQWSTDYAAAATAAREQKKQLLLNFTGSDWCGYCMLIDRQVLATPEFQKFAQDNFVCVTLDFPRGKPQSEAVQKQNAELAEKYGVDGFPTFVVADPNGHELGRLTGYAPGSGPQPVIQQLKAAINK